MRYQGYDVIVIGSGIGGLCAAAVLAKLRGMRVLVLEQHAVLGGFTHQFRRSGGRTWDVGLHYVGELEAGSPGRALFDFVGEGRISWRRLADPYDRILTPDLSFEIHGDIDRYRSDLIARFPAERLAIVRYFKDVKRAAAWGARYFASCLAGGWVGRALRRPSAWTDSLALQTTQSYMDRRFRDPRLKALLTSRWGIHGLEPERSAFLAHAIVTRHYWRGSYYPEGGSGSLARAIAIPIERAGGALRIRHEVTRIVVDRGCATGVVVRYRANGRTVEEPVNAGVVISNVGAPRTYADLLPREVGAPILAELNQLGERPTAVLLHLSLRDSPERLGLGSANLWISEGEERGGAQSFAEVLRGHPSECFVSFPSLKGSDSREHTAELMAFSSHSSFRRYADSQWKRRGPEYEASKERITEGVLDLVERHVPGFRGLVTTAELSTPLTVEHFTRHPGGAIYGIPSTPARFRREWPGARTPLANLYLAGADTFFHGVLGAAFGGVAAAGAVIGRFGFFRAMGAALSASRRSGGER